MQWRAVMKYGVRSWRTLLTMKPVQKREPPVEMTATAAISSRQSSPAAQTTSTLHDPESASPASPGDLPNPR